MPLQQVGGIKGWHYQRTVCPIQDGEYHSLSYLCVRGGIMLSQQLTACGSRTTSQESSPPQPVQHSWQILHPAYCRSYQQRR